MLCELGGEGVRSLRFPNPPNLPLEPAFSDILGEIGRLQNRLIAISTPPLSNAIFDQKGFDSLLFGYEDPLSSYSEIVASGTFIKVKLDKLPPMENDLLTEMAAVCQRPNQRSERLSDILRKHLPRRADGTLLASTPQSTPQNVSDPFSIGDDLRPAKSPARHRR